MISYLTSADMSIIAFIGVIFAFALTCIAIAKLNKFLPKDLGRQFAVDGKLSAGKPRGAGIIFIFTFVISAVLFSQINAEIAIYLVLELKCRYTTATTMATAKSSAPFRYSPHGFSAASSK